VSEEFYDKEIAPKLAELANLCGERGMAFVAVVEYAHGERGRTERIPEGSGLAMTMLAHCAKMGENIDGYVIGLYRYAKAKGIDMSRSIVMSRWGKP
jgi:hypothetical protein